MGRLVANVVRVPSIAPPTGRRADIDGLRALAIALVVTYHVWFDRVSGGVDVFLLISAYLLTESFTRRAEQGRPLLLAPFWLRRFASLLPAAAVTILAVLAFTALVLPESTWPGVWSQAWASLTYTQNWDLAFASVDYFARVEHLPSPLMHFWSLSVQGQVFLVWPMLILGGVRLAGRISTPPRTVLLWLFGAVFVASFLYSIASTAESQQFAYFDTFARLWEFALGSIAALVAPRIRIGTSTGVLLGWTGVVGLVSCGLLLDVRAGFPGSAALWPTLCAVAILWAGQADATGAPTRLLSSPALRGLGRIAYALYLVHWPILIGYLALTEHDRAGATGGVLVIMLSLTAAVALHMIVERPAASRVSPRTAISFIVIPVLIVVVPLCAWQVGERVRALVSDGQANPGAGVLVTDADVRVRADAPILPFGSTLDQEWVGFGAACTGDLLPSGAAAQEICMERRSSTTGAPTVLVMGDSHAAQWTGTILPAAEAQDWNLVGVYRGGCALTPADVPDDDVGCLAWQDAAFDFARDTPADVVVLMGTRAVPDDPGERVPSGIEDSIDMIVGSGSDVVLLRDNPRFTEDMFRCVEMDPTAFERCSRSKGAVLAGTNPAGVFGGRTGVHVIDLSDAVCPNDLCSAVVGNVAVYMDDNHITWTYAKTLAPFMAHELARIPALAPQPSAMSASPTAASAMPVLATRPSTTSN